jgi:16S rRNA processing protein RimM
MLQKEVWLEDKDFQKYAGKSAPISLVGFKVIHEGNDLGEILEVIEQPHQVLCRIELQQKEVLIPINEETLQKTDKKNRKIIVKLPDGLLDLYLGV